MLEIIPRNEQLSLCPSIPALELYADFANILTIIDALKLNKALITNKEKTVS